MNLVFRGIFWVVVYLLVAVAPLVFAWSGPEPGRGFVINFSVALGFVGLAMMGLQFALVSRFRTVSAPFGVDVMLQYHRQMAYVALAFILAHPLLLFVYDPGKFLPLLNPLTTPLGRTWPYSRRSPCSPWWRSRSGERGCAWGTRRGSSRTAFWAS